MSTLRRALIVAAALASTGLNARPMTPEDVARIEALSNIALSRDGTRIAFTTGHRPDVTRGEANGPALQQLFMAQGPMAVRAYLPDTVNAQSIGFSPDGHMVTYLWNQGDAKRSLWGVPVDGGAPVELAAIRDGHLLDYAFTPDGAGVYLLAQPATDTTREEEAGKGFNAVVFEEEQRFNRLFYAALGGDGPDAAPRAIAVPGHVDEIDLAPDATWMLVSSAPSTLVDDNYMRRRPYIVDLVSGEARAIATSGKLGDLEMSPDGSQLAMIAAGSENDPAATTLFLVDVATGTMRALNEGAPEAAVDTEWMADGRLAVAVDRGVQSRLRFYDASGTQSGEDIDPQGRIITALQQGGNRLALRAEAPDHPGELFLYDSGAFVRWTDHNPWLAQIDRGTQSAYTYTARDGQQIEGVLLEPVGGVPAGGAPLILDVHGGPESHETNGWITSYSNPGQVAAGRGYAVFLPNYRGSTGYGVAFAMSHQGDYAGKEFDDLVDAKAALVAGGLADPARVGITGGSYGGYASAWGATYYSAEFAASVMFVGIANNLSKFGTTDIPNEMYLVHERAWPWDEIDHLIERSPITYADRATTPLLIMHGDKDPRVSPTQSLELYRHISLRQPDTPLRLVLYPGEAHGNAQAAARYDYNLRMMEWFDTYLMTGNRAAPIPGPRPALQLQAAPTTEGAGPAETPAQPPAPVDPVREPRPSSPDPVVTERAD
jgi:dipeptidyl aminopeptidase/acylaminoacyl peptidase